jgi:hypothetical protein
MISFDIDNNLFLIDNMYDCLIIAFVVAVYIPPTLYRLYEDFPALLMEEDLRCPSLALFPSPEQNHQRSVL